MMGIFQEQGGQAGLLGPVRLVFFVLFVFGLVFKGLVLFSFALKG